MGCGVSRPETDEEREEREYKRISRRRSIDKDSEIADSLISDREHFEMSTHSKNSKSGGEKTTKEDRWRIEEEKGDEIKMSPASPSFRIYCVYPKDPNDDNVVDDNHEMQRNNYMSDENKEMKRRKQPAVGMKIKRRLNNVKKLLIAPAPTPTPTPSSSTTS